MARPVALTPMRSDAARKMRRTASDLDRDHPETVAGDHVRDAARVLEHGGHDGAKRHLDAAMEVLTPRNLMRHGILDDEGHATAKQHMHEVNRHRLAVQDIEDAQGRNQRLKEAAAAKTVPPGSVTRAGGASDGPQQAPAPVPAPAAPRPPQRPAGGGKSPGLPPPGPPDPGPVPVSKMRAAERKLANEIELKAAWMSERRDRGGQWVTGAGLAGALGRTGGKGRAPSRPYVSPGQESFNRVIFGKKISKGEAGTFAEMLGGGVRLKSIKQDRATLTKSQKAVYDRLRKRGRGHAKSMLVAQRFSPQMLKAAAFASDAAAIVLAFDPAEPRGRGGEWIRSSSRANTILHGLTVTGRTRDGTEVTGMYHHYEGTVRPQPGGRPVRVSEVLNPHAAFGRRDAARRRLQQGRPGFFERVANRVGGFGPPVQAAGGSPAIELFNPAQPRGAHGRWAHTGAPSVSIGKIAGVHGAGSFHHARFMDRYADTQLRHPDSKRLLKMATRSMVKRDFPAALRHIAGARWHDANFEAGAHLADLDEMARGVREAAGRPALGGRLYPRAATSSLGPASQHPGRYQASKGNLTGYANPLTELSARTAELERTPAPRGRPGGPGLYDVKGLGHTPYLQQVVKALIEKRGMEPGKAYAIARAAIRKWSRGGGHVHPEVAAAAGRAEAGEIARQARAKSHAIGPWEVADTLVELACEPIDLFNPFHAPPGSPAGGQFTTQQQAQQKQQARQKQKQQAARQEHRQDRAQRAALLRKIAGVRQQIAALQAMLPKPKGARKAAKARTPAAAAAAAKRAAAAKSRGATPRKKGVAAKRMSPATIHARIAALQGVLRADLARLKTI